MNHPLVTTGCILGCICIASQYKQGDYGFRNNPVIWLQERLYASILWPGVAAAL